MPLAKKYELAIAIGGKVDSSLSSSVAQAGNELEKLGSMAKTAVGVATGAMVGMKVKDFFDDSIETYKTYEQSLATTAATAGVQKGSADYVKLQEAARKAGRETRKTAAESADALGYMALAGWDVNESVQGLTPILKLSEATQADLATSSDLVTDSMSALGVTVEELPRYLDIATQANNKSNQTALQMMEAYTGVGGTLKRLGTPLEESGTLLGVLANRGKKGSEAGNDLSSVLINLTKKSGESADAMSALGINAYDSQGNFKGVTNVLEEVNDKTKDLTAEQRDTYLTMIGGKTQIATLNALMDGLNTTNAEGVSELEALQEALEGSDGALDEMANTVNDTMRGAMDRLSSATDDFKIELIENLEPTIVPVLNGIAESLPGITENIGETFDRMRENFSGVKKVATDVIQVVSGFGTLLSGEELTPEEMASAKIDILATTGMDSSQLDSVLQTLGGLKEDASAVLSMVQTGLGGVLTTAKTLGGFVVENMDTILPLVVAAGKAYAGFKLAKLAVGAGKAASAFGALTKFKLTDKIETLSIKALYAKDAVVKGVGLAGKAFGLLTSPVGLAVAAIAGAIAIGVLLYKNWDTVKEKADELWTGVTTIFGGIRDSISGAFKTGANAGISALNMLIRAANGIQINIPDWVPKLGGKTYGINIPEIPALATGGIVTGPTLAAIGEGSESEVVFPLSKLESFLSDKINNHSSERSESGEVFRIEYAPQIIIQGNADEKDVEKALKISKEEFARMMDEWTKNKKRPSFT